MMLRLALATLSRRRARTALTTAGVAVAAAMLLDMVMLGSGMRESFRGFIEQQGFQIRLTPRGTMPFDSEATVGGGAALVKAVAADPDVVKVAPLIGAKVFVRVGAAAASATRSDSVVAAFVLGIVPAVQGDYLIVEGREIAAPDEMVVNASYLAATGFAVGDTVQIAAGYDAQMRRFAGTRTVRIVARARFVMLGGTDRAAALPLETVQSMGGPERADRVSVVMVATRPSADIETVRLRLEAADARVSALSTAAALKFVDERLGYFRQLAFILASVSLAVGFLLVTTLVTVSVNERIGEIAVMRAIGVARWRIVAQVMAEGVALSLVGAVIGLGLGLITAKWLNGILAAFPGLPAAFDFFYFEPAAAFRSLGLLVLCGIAAGVWPAWRAATLPIAKTLREEAVA
ncbi:MAG: ABC transporter permease [Gemmatimonadaceae bacterium]